MVQIITKSGVLLWLSAYIISVTYWTPHSYYFASFHFSVPSERGWLGTLASERRLVPLLLTYAVCEPSSSVLTRVLMYKVLPHSVNFLFHCR